MATPIFDLRSRLIEYERGELDTLGFLELYAELVRTGQAWEQQGFYELVATDLIESGYITPEGTISVEGYKATGEAGDNRVPPSSFGPGVHAGAPLVRNQATSWAVLDESVILSLITSLLAIAGCVWVTRGSGGRENGKEGTNVEPGEFTLPCVGQSATERRPKWQIRNVWRDGSVPLPSCSVSQKRKNPRIGKSNFAPLIYLNGLLLFVAGLSIVREHNLWTRSGPVMVTLVGWAGILLGLFRMFAPEVQQARQSAPETIATASLVGAIGLFLTFKAGFEHDGGGHLRYRRRAGG